MEKTLDFSKVKKNGIINLSFQIIPVLLALYSIPKLLSFYGEELWGFYTLFITFLMLFNHINFGIAPSTAKLISEFIGQNRHGKIGVVVFNSFIWNIIIISFSSVIYFVTQKYLVDYFGATNFNVTQCLNYVLLCGAILLFNSCFRAFFEAMQMYVLVSIIRSLLSAVIFLAPLLLSFTSHHEIEDMLLFILFTYMTSFLVYIVSFYLTCNGSFFKYDSLIFTRLYSWGKWLGLHSLLSPFLLYLDRFLIKSFLSVNVVALYTIPFDLSARMSLISGSYTSSFYTAVSRWNKQKHINISIYYFKTLQTILIIISIISILGMLLSEFFLNLWISQEFSINNYKILQILIFANFFNAINITSLRFLQGVGELKYPITIQLLLIPIYIFMLISFVHYDVWGVALSFLIRMVIESTILTSKVIMFLKARHTIYKSDYKELIKILCIVFIVSSLLLIFT